jgi:hypothetical protein
LRHDESWFDVCGVVDITAPLVGVACHHGNIPGFGSDIWMMNMPARPSGYMADA